MESCEYTANSPRVVFGSGSLKKLPEEVSRLNISRPLLLSTPQKLRQAAYLESILHGRIAGLFNEAAMHTPVDVTEKALEYAKLSKANSIISIGGGSTTGLGKAISIRTRLQHRRKKLKMPSPDVDVDFLRLLK